jgi:hypothetical protein
MPNKNDFDRYLLALRRTPIDEKTEHTDRAALQSILQSIASAGAGDVLVHHEPKRVVNKGAPDFKIAKSGLILGYVENKAIGENLDTVLKSDQIARYKSLSQNIILTDYLHFIWINKDGIQRETLCHATDLENPRFRLREDRVVAVTKLLQGFFSTAPEGIGRAQHSHTRSPRAASCFATIWRRNWFARNGSTRKGGFTDSSKYSVTRSSTNWCSRNSPMLSRRCLPTGCFSRD